MRQCIHPLEGLRPASPPPFVFLHTPQALEGERKRLTQLQQQAAKEQKDVGRSIRTYQYTCTCKHMVF